MSVRSDLSRGSGLVVASALRLEARAVRRGAPKADVVVTGMGPARAQGALHGLRRLVGSDRPFAVVGCAGGLTSDLKAGDVVVAEEVRGPSGTTELPGAAFLASVMRRAGLPVRSGVVVSTTDRVVRGAERAALAATGAVVVDMESWWLLETVAGTDAPRAVVRVVLDTPSRELPSMWTPLDTVRCYRSLLRTAMVLEAWAQTAAGPREVLLAGPRSVCAGVERAIEVVERAMERFGTPVYVRKQIVHNAHVVSDLANRGAVFVDDLAQVPDGATVIFSAHGVSPKVREEAATRDLHVIDATCPLVAKVHAEARRFVRHGYSVVFVGHAGHEETEGTLGEAAAAGQAVPGSAVVAGDPVGVATDHPVGEPTGGGPAPAGQEGTVQLVESVDDVDTIEVADPTKVAYLTQTTLAPDETAAVLDRLRYRFPDLVGPASADICYATQNRQEAARAVAKGCDLMLVIGSPNSSNSNRLVEVVGREGCTARLIDDETGIRLDWLRGARRIGITAGASAPESLVHRVVDALASLGPLQVTEHSVTTESVQFALPAEVR